MDTQQISQTGWVFGTVIELAKLVECLFTNKVVVYSSSVEFT